MYKQLSLSYKNFKWAVSLVLLLVAIFSWIKPQCLSWLFADDAVNQFFKQSMLRATSLYSVSAGVNGIVSVVQDSEIEAAPAGVGLSIAAGEILDPVNDLAERLSDTMLSIMALLGVEKLIHDILGEVLFLRIIALLIVIWVVSLYVAQQRGIWLRKVTQKIVLVLLSLRLVLATAFLVEGVLYKYFFAEKLTPHQTYLAKFNSEFKGELNKSHEVSFVTKGKVAKEYIAKVWKEREELSHHLLQLGVWSLSIFALQMLILPLSIWFLLRYLFLMISSSRFIKE